MLFIILTIHESFHVLSARIVGLKNKVFGIAIFGAFVDVDLRKATRRQKSFVFLSAPIFSILSLSIIYYLIYFSGLPFNYNIYLILWTFAFVSIFINGFNLLPTIRGNDAYNTLSLYTKKTRGISIASNIMISAVLFAYSLFSFNLGLLLSIAMVLTYIIPVYLVDRYFKKGIKLSKGKTKKGFHMISNKTGFYYSF